jgi:hypothetical protein
MDIDFFDATEMLGRFNLLMRDLLAGHSKRNGFAPWEVELLIDIAGCRLEPGRERSTLIRYRQAATRQFENGKLAPMKLSEYLQARQRETAGEDR